MEKQRYGMHEWWHQKHQHIEDKDYIPKECDVDLAFGSVRDKDYEEIETKKDLERHCKPCEYLKSCVQFSLLYNFLDGKDK